MIIEGNVQPYIVFQQDSVAAALQKISDNKAGFVVCVNEYGVVHGVLTDGDFRRWIAAATRIDLSIPVERIANTGALTRPVDADAGQLAELFSEVIRFIPMVDERGRLRAVALNRSEALNIADKVVGRQHPAFLIAEIGINHNGSVDLAKRMVDEAAKAGADCAKFQMRNMAALYRNPDAGTAANEDLGAQYTLDVLARAQLTVEEMYAVFDHCRDTGIIPLCTPWDAESVEVLERYGVDAYKVASADLTNHELLNRMSRAMKPLIVSTGMSREEEIRETIGLLRNRGVPFALLHCNSTYPAPFKDVNLNYMRRLAEIGDVPVGYSGHERGFEVPIAAVALGASIIEKHFTLDRDMEGNDHKVSLLPYEFAEMVAAIRNVEEALGTDAARQVTVGERMNRENLAKSLVAARPIHAGETITTAMVAVRSPGQGLQPNRRAELLHTTARRDMAAGDFFYESDLHDEVSGPRTYRFERPFGVPVRFHDYQALASRTNLDFIEFHFSYRDLGLHPADFFDAPLDIDFACHSPDLFEGDHLLNLAAEDDDYWQRSITELQRVIDTSRRLKEWFPAATGPTRLIVSLGGFSRNHPLPIESRPEMYARVIEGLRRLSTDGVEILPQTLPPYPWYFGGQLYCNLFVDPEDTVAFCHDAGLRLCFDVCHSKLATNERRTSFHEFVDTVGPLTGHLHIVDAVGVDGEGVQIGDGEIDFPELARQLERLCPDAGFIPEIWQGHKNGGEGFWIALERLEGLF